jgi:small basic protein
MRGGFPGRLLAVTVAMLAALSVVFGGVRSASASQISGAIFTTLHDGSEVNFNIYAAKEDVYLNGGPGIHAPSGAAGLVPDGTYVFQVTDPSGKTLLSQDPAGCRQVTVVGGIFTGVVPFGGCQHLSEDNLVTQVGGKTVQLMPYADTPNNGNEYKVWATPLADFTCALTDVDCANDTHGFVPGFSKTDNFKVKGSVREMDTRFHDASTGALIDGLGIAWTDTLGASNNKWSYFSAALDVNHEAHVEAPENGTHQITVNNQLDPRDPTGATFCTVTGPIQVSNTYTGASYFTSISGPQTVSVKVLPSFKSGTIFLDVTVTCQ